VTQPSKAQCDDCVVADLICHGSQTLSGSAMIVEVYKNAVPSGCFWKWRKLQQSDGWFLFMVGSAQRVFNALMRGEDN
jgi:hypothetical protein